MLRRTILSVAAVLALSVPAVLSAAPAKPKSVIHVVTVKWKAEATPAQIDAAIKGVETMNFPGLKNVWTKPIKKQLQEGYNHIIVMEFESEDALQKYSGSEAQKKWYEVYMPARGESRTHDITN